MSIEIKRILCPTDFSENSKHAMKYALTLAALSQAELELFHVVEPITYPQSTELFEPVLDEVELTMKMGAAFQKQLEDQVAALKEEYPKTEGKIVTGNTFLEIIQVARDEKVDMIVMGTHGRTGLAHVLIGSVAEKVVREAPCPVLTVKHPEHEFVKP
ncbi:MAG: universal stress protein [Desulfobacterales bacterium]|jgi:nucleotide-binding universal stress UspA family protein